MAKKILLIEDEEKIARFTELELVHEGYEVKKAFNDPHEIITTEMDVIVDLLYSELSSSINYFQMQTGYRLNKVLFSAATDLQKEFAEKLAEKSYIPLTIPEFYKEFSKASFDASEFAGCISLAKAALEG